MGCDTGKFHPSCRQENLWKQGQEKVVLFVGRLAEKKGVRYLIEAMQWVNARLVIVGDGPLKEELQEQVILTKLEHKVLFAGAKSHEELPEIYASADTCVVPSIVAKDKDKEGFGLVILEAMASGVPVVASKSGGIVEILQHEENGLLVKEKNSRELAENINRILFDEELRYRIISNMQNTVERYEYGNVGRRYAALINYSEVR